VFWIDWFCDLKANFYLQLSPLSIIHSPCNMSFHSQHTGIGSCPKTLRFSIHFFQNDHFPYIPWRDVTAHKFTIAVPNMPITKDFSLDNSTLQSLDRTYNSLDRDLTLRLDKFNNDVDNLNVDTATSMTDVFTYLSFALTLWNLLPFFFLFRRFGVVYLSYQNRHPAPVSIPLATHTDTSTLDWNLHLSSATVLLPPVPRSLLEN